ncbi:hypothetical protein BH09PSE4_BH09PSE4_03420 [soil metagenome]
MVQLNEHPYHQGKSPSPDRKALAALVHSLELSEDAAARLLDDSSLIAEWYLLPQRRAQLGLGHEQLLKSVRKAAKQAHRLGDVLELDALAIEELIAATPDEEEASDSIDIYQLQRDLHQFAHAADRALSLSPKAGRAADVHRNHTLAMAVEAVEDATGERVKTSDGNKRNPDWHFSTPSGHYVVGLMKLVGGPDERVLVGALKRLRRVKRVK